MCPPARSLLFHKQNPKGWGEALSRAGSKREDMPRQRRREKDEAPRVECPAMDRIGIAQAEEIQNDQPHLEKGQRQNHSNGDEPAAWRQVQDLLSSGMDPEDLYLDSLGPTMEAVGDAWQHGDLTVGDEHKASTVMIRLTARLGPLFSTRGRKRGVIVLATPPGDRHSLPVTLLADDVGLGKTIEAGLVIQELLLRHRARTVIVICPAGLVFKWQDEMQEKFGLDFTVVNSETMKQVRRSHGVHANPFTLFPRIIVSMAWLPGQRRSYTSAGTPWLGASEIRTFLGITVL